MHSLLVILNENNLFCQNLTFQSGRNYGRQHAFKNNDPHVSNEFNWGTGYSFGILFSDVQFKTKHNYSFYMGFESFGGGFKSSYSGLGGGFLKSGDYQKYVIDFEFYPWKIEVFKNFFISPGFELNGTVGKKLSGTYSQYQMGTSIPIIDLKDYKGIIGPFNAGTNMNLSYCLNFKKITVSPSYKFSFFILTELKLGIYSFSQRHSLLVSFGYTLK